jgi:hypothetical protein
MIARLLVLAIVIGGVLALVISHITYKLPLARMSDPQLVERFEQTWNSYSQVEADLGLSNCGPHFVVQSGILRHTHFSHGQQ